MKHRLIEMRRRCIAANHQHTAMSVDTTDAIDTAAYPSSCSQTALVWTILIEYVVANRTPSRRRDPFAERPRTMLRDRPTTAEHRHHLGVGVARRMPAALSPL
jgi:hypothetical protein